MSKNTAILIIIITVLVALGGFIAWFLFLSPGAQTESLDENNLFSKFFPSGSQPQNTGNTGTLPTGNSQNQQGTGQTTGNTNEPAPQIRKVSDAPVAGFTLIQDKQKGTIARYMEAATGHTYSAPLNVITSQRLTLTTIPKVREALFLSAGDRAIARYLDDSGYYIKSFAGKLNYTKTDVGTVTEGDFQGTFLRDDILQMVASPAGDKIFYLIKENGGAAGIVANTDGSKAAKIFSSPIREWLAQWPISGTIYLGNKPSGLETGNLYSIPAGGGSLAKILSNISGLTANVNSKNTALLYSHPFAGGFELSYYDLKTKSEKQLPFNTLSDKCAWDPSSTDVIYCGIPQTKENAIYPDAWYQGTISFNDNLWRINVKTGEAKEMAGFSKVTSSLIDIENPHVSASGEYVVFRNKHDLTLWSVKVK
jgi:hypothetical protein